VTAPPGRLHDFRRIVGDATTVVTGGETRSASVRAGIASLAAEPEDVIAVHDAARPLVTAEEARQVVAAAERTGAAIAAIPVVDTIKLVHESRIVRTVDRSALWAAATPQAFRARVLGLALESGRDATDEASLCEDLGIPVEAVEISRLGFKVTTPADLVLAEAVLRARAR
jgi:2-C-methyl-D-erythritol 4-phosphate cytidylyltransferase